MTNKSDSIEGYSDHNIELCNERKTSCMKKLSNQSSTNNGNNNNEKKKIYSLISFSKFSKCKYNTAEIIKEISDYVLSAGTNDINNILSKHENNNYEKLVKYEDLILNFEKIDNDNIIILCTKNKIYSINLEKVTKKREILNDLKDKNFNFIFKINKDNYVLCQKDKVSIINHLMGKYKEGNILTISNEYYREGISINNDIFALVSNSVISSGKDILTIYNIHRKKDIKMFKGSFILSSTGLQKMLYKNENENKNEILLLCACKKYLKGQKNGILLIYNLESENVKISHKFYSTDKFEVHCFCPIFNISKKYIFKTNDNINITNYFFVGGFDTAKIKGSIKLYKINKIKENNKEIFEIKKIQDIMIPKNEQFKGFKGAISCIEQSKRNGDIYITSWNGDVFLFNNLNLSLLFEKPFI